MPLIEDLLALHAPQLPESARTALEDAARRLRAREACAYPADMTDLEAQSGFLLIEREFPDRPVSLFGQDVPSLAHTRLRIFRARGAGDAPMRVDEEIFSARISEKALTDAMLNTNRGHDLAPVTITRLGTTELPAHVPGPNRATIAAEAYAEDQREKTRARLSALHACADAAARPSADLRNALRNVGYAARDLTSVAFNIERHLETRNAQRTEVLTEAAHAALHAHKVADSLAAGIGPELITHQEPDWSEVAATAPMVDFMQDEITEAYVDGLRRLLVAELRRLAVHAPKLHAWITTDAEGQETPWFPEPREISMALSGAGEDARDQRAHVESMKSAWNHATNPHIARDRPAFHPTQGVLAVTRTQGWTGDLHTSLPPTDSTSFRLAIQPAFLHHEHGTPRMRTRHTPVIEIAMVGEDLMTALRGHPEGLPVPCSLRAVAGIWRPAVARPRTAIQDDIATLDAEAQSLPEVAALSAQIDAVRALVETKRSGKAWRIELMDAIELLETRFEAADAALQAHLDTARGTVDAHVAESARTMLGAISRSLPPTVLDVLRLPGADRR